MKKIFMLNKNIVHLIDDIFWNMGFKTETQADKVMHIIPIARIISIISIIRDTYSQGLSLGLSLGLSYAQGLTQGLSLESLVVMHIMPIISIISIIRVILIIRIICRFVRILDLRITCGRTSGR